MSNISFGGNPSDIVKAAGAALGVAGGGTAAATGAGAGIAAAAAAAAPFVIGGAAIIGAVALVAHLSKKK